LAQAISKASPGKIVTGEQREQKLSPTINGQFSNKMSSHRLFMVKFLITASTIEPICLERRSEALFSS
jgi:hypothetical protein